MKNTELEQLINEKLNSAAISDYAPNGLQVEGKETVQKIVTGVTASQALLDEAVRLGADAVIVHHGYFWKGESPVIRGMKRNRLKTLLANDIKHIRRIQRFLQRQERNRQIRGNGRQRPFPHSGRNFAAVSRVFPV